MANSLLPVSGPNRVPANLKHNPKLPVPKNRNTSKKRNTALTSAPTTWEERTREGTHQGYPPSTAKILFTPIHPPDLLELRGSDVLPLLTSPHNKTLGIWTTGSKVETVKYSRGEIAWSDRVAVLTRAFTTRTLWYELIDEGKGLKLNLFGSPIYSLQIDVRRERRRVLFLCPDCERWVDCLFILWWNNCAYCCHACLHHGSPRHPGFIPAINAGVSDVEPLRVQKGGAR